MKKCKVAFINVMDGYSGGEIVLQRLIQELDKEQFECLIYTKNTKFIDMLKCSECHVTIVHEQYQLKLQRGLKAFLFAARNFLVSGKYVYRMKFYQKVDILHSNSLTSSIYFAFWAKVFRLKFIAHNHLIRRGKPYNILYKYINFCSDKIVCVSEAVKNCWLDEGISEEKLIVIYNGLPNDFF